MHKDSDLVPVRVVSSPNFWSDEPEDESWHKGRTLVTCLHCATNHEAMKGSLHPGDTFKCHECGRLVSVPEFEAQNEV